jgi:transcriptional regulator GlxA family with amidase domain
MLVYICSASSRAAPDVERLAIELRDRYMPRVVGAVREVRLRRAHQSLLESDPSTTSVASVAYRRGFTNLDRFAAAHTARYDEPPASTLRRPVYR